MSREWYRFFLNLFRLTGSGSNDTTLEDLQLVPTPYTEQQVPASLYVTAGELAAQLASVQNELEGLALQPPQPEIQHLHYGAFHDTNTQTAAVANTAYAMTFSNTDFSDGVERGTTTSRIICRNLGVYNFQFSIQMTKTGGAAVKFAYIWARINGVDVPDSATRIAFSGNNNDLVAAWNFLLRMQANDYFELMWSVEDTNIQIISLATIAPAPAIPSVILTVTEATI